MNPGSHPEQPQIWIVWDRNRTKDWKIHGRSYHKQGMIRWYKWWQIQLLFCVGIVTGRGQLCYWACWMQRMFSMRVHFWGAVIAPSNSWSTVPLYIWIHTNIHTCIQPTYLHAFTYDQLCAWLRNRFVCVTSRCCHQNHVSMPWTAVTKEFGRTFWHRHVLT